MFPASFATLQKGIYESMFVVLLLSMSLSNNISIRYQPILYKQSAPRPNLP